VRFQRIDEIRHRAFAEQRSDDDQAAFETKFIRRQTECLIERLPRQIRAFERRLADDHTGRGAADLKRHRERVGEVEGLVPPLRGMG